MYLHVTNRAGLVLIGLVMERGRARRGKVHRRRVALHAQRIDVVTGKQARVDRPVRSMA